MAHVYILRSLASGKYYIGSTRDLDSRIKDHASGKVHSTKSLRPLELVFSQELSSYSEARVLENKLKSYKRKDFIEKIIKDGHAKASPKKCPCSSDG